MIKRIVKMEFKSEHIKDFINIFADVQSQIKDCDGCYEVELYQDEKFENILFTVSQWESTEALDAYRNSKLFQGAWPKVKSLFSNKAQAWSLNQI